MMDIIINNMDKVFAAVSASTGVAIFAINVYNIPYQKIKTLDYTSKQRLFFKYKGFLVKILFESLNYIIIIS